MPVCTGAGGTLTFTETLAAADTVGEAVAGTIVFSPRSPEPAQATNATALTTRHPVAEIVLIIEPPEHRNRRLLPSGADSHQQSVMMAQVGASVSGSP
ncbi:hypothetical protein ACH474_25890 [Nocardia rhamnosiphila]|uniref:hypothetical protein n=1 Tax=Nocardia rhamnosiphila TaxID=426716 RepID=UPI0004C3E30D|nr:hypothetical protein [Nocardia rhamnosiphila]